jgi:hypothetical protein
MMKSTVVSWVVYFCQLTEILAHAVILFLFTSSILAMDFQIYQKICEFIRNYNGLQLDCDRDIRKAFPDIAPRTLSAILSRELQQRQIATHPKMSHKSQALLKE